MSTEKPELQALSRRDVVKGAAATGAAFALPALIASTAHGQKKKKDQADAADTADSNSKRIRLGFIGVGKMSSGHLGYFTGRPDTEVLAIAEVDKGRREHFVKQVDDKYKDLQRSGAKPCQGYVDYKELLARDDIDAVVIGTPDHWHAAILIEAANAKKDIYCEKPLTLTIEEAKACVEAVQKNKVVMQTGSQQRTEGPFRDVCDYIRNGKLGKIKEVFVAIGGTHSNPCDLPEEKPASEIDWNQWLGQAPERSYHSRLAHAGELPNKYPFNPGWREYKEYSGGFVTDWGAHHFDITQWALSMDGSGPVEIHPPAEKGADYGAKFIYRGSPAGDEIVVTHLQEIPDVPDAKNPGKTKKERNGILFVGEKGRIFVNRSTKVSDPEELVKTPLSEGDKRLKADKSHRENWLNCIRSRELPTANVVVGAGSVTVCHLVNLAYWNGQKMKWDPKAWKFEDAEQNKWLSRPRREGFDLPKIG